jgi:hypothetical protein
VRIRGLGTREGDEKARCGVMGEIVRWKEVEFGGLVGKRFGDLLAL